MSASTACTPRRLPALTDYRQVTLTQLVANRYQVLDLGCAAIPNPYFTGQDVTGLDLSPAPDPLPANYARILRGDATLLPDPFPPESFDAIVAGEILEHLEHPVAFLRACHRTLRPGGRLALSTPNPNSVYERILTLTMSRRWFYDPEHVMLFPQRWLVRMAEIAGFRNVRISSGGLSLPFLPATFPFPRPWAEFTILAAEK